MWRRGLDAKREACLRVIVYLYRRMKRGSERDGPVYERGDALGDGPWGGAAGRGTHDGPEAVGAPYSGLVLVLIETVRRAKRLEHVLLCEALNNRDGA